MEIEDALGETSPDLVRPPTITPGWTRTRAGLIAAVALTCVTLGALGGWFASTRRSPSPTLPSRFLIPLQSDQRLDITPAAPMAISPDGQMLVFAAMPSTGRTQLFIRTLNKFEATALPGTENGSAPFFSADGRWIGFYGDGALQRVSIVGGPALKICDAPPLWSATWTPTDTIIFSTTLRGDGLWRIPALGGTPEQLTKPNRQGGELQHSYPQMLGDGTHVLLSIVKEHEWRLALLSLQTRQIQRMVQGGPIGVGARFVSTGHVVYAQAGGLLAVPFSPERGEFTGAPIPMLERVDTARAGTASFAVSSTGSLVFVGERRSLPRRMLVSVDRDGGHVIPLLSVGAPSSHPRFSRDGSLLTVTIENESGSDIWLYDLARATRTRLTRNGLNDFPEWSPDGAHVTFQSDRSGPAGTLFSVPKDGSRDAQPLMSGVEAEEGLNWGRGTAGLLPGTVPTLSRANPQSPMSWSMRGEVLAFDERKPNAERDIWILSPGSEPAPFLVTPSDEHSATFSPDSHWLAYSLGRIGARGSLRATLSGTWREVADLEQWRD